MSKQKKKCTWPACPCRATGKHCDDKPEKKKPKGIRRVSAKRQAQLPAEREMVKNDAWFYLVIWNEREHKCQNCGAEILQFSILWFHHILPKREDGGYPQYRYCKWNIWILCWQCHDTHDNGNPGSKTLHNLSKEKLRLQIAHDNGQLKPCRELERAESIGESG